MDGMTYDIVVQGPNGKNRVIRSTQLPKSWLGGLFQRDGTIDKQPGSDSVAASNPNEVVAAPNEENLASPFESAFKSENVAQPAGENVASNNENVAIFPLNSNLFRSGALFNFPNLGDIASKFTLPVAGPVAAPAAHTSNTFKSSISKTLDLPDLSDALKLPNIISGFTR